MANFKGITLPDGTTYTPPEINTVNVSVDNNTGTPSATASVSDDVLTLAFQNLKGEQGPTGPQGPAGATGATPNLQIGDVTTLQPDQQAMASITGTPENPLLNLGIPQGQAATSDKSVETFLIEVPENVSSVDLFSGKSYKNVEIYSIAKLTMQAVLILYINEFYSEIGTVPNTYFGGGYFCRSAVGSNGSVVTKLGFGSTFSCLNDSKHMDSINTANVTLSDEGNEIVAGSAFLVIGYN